jgi:hypothetical protein
VTAPPSTPLRTGLPDAPVETVPRRLLCRALAAGHVIVDAGCEFFAWQLARDGLAVVHTRPRALDPSTGSGGCGQLTWIEAARSAASRRMKIQPRSAGSARTW